MFEFRKKDTKMCAKCDEWYHVSCVADDIVKYKMEVEGASLDDIADEFVCCNCSKNGELVAKFAAGFAVRSQKKAAKMIDDDEDDANLTTSGSSNLFSSSSDESPSPAKSKSVEMVAVVQPAQNLRSASMSSFTKPAATSWTANSGSEDSDESPEDNDNMRRGRKTTLIPRSNSVNLTAPQTSATRY
jgi:hypothetical protein